jgi:hypothetical protein
VSEPDALVRRLRGLGVLGYTPAEIRFVYATMAELRPDWLCEWGTNVGHSARLFHEARVALELDCELHSVDSLAEPPVLRPADEGRRRGEMAWGYGVNWYVGDGAEVAVRLYARTARSRPLLFLDSNHEEAEVYTHLSLLGDEIPEAVLLVHDACLARHGEPERALRRFLAEHPGYETADVQSGQAMVRLWPELAPVAC